MAGMHGASSVGWRATLLIIGALAALGCTEEPDVVAYPLALEAGAPGDSGSDAAVGHCDESERIKRARLPAKLLMDLKSSPDGCSAPYEDFVPPDAGMAAFSFARLRQATGVQTPTDLAPERSIESLCEQYPRFAIPVPLEDPERVVLCPRACTLFYGFVKGVLSLDGCDDAQGDDAGSPAAP